MNTPQFGFNHPEGQTLVAVRRPFVFQTCFGVIALCF